MIGSNIKKLRTERGLTQKALADKLFVSAQAVSRWENNEVEPSVGTITELAKIFGVSTDEIFGIEVPQQDAEPTIKVEKEYVYMEPPKQSIALCSRCNSQIFETSDIVRTVNSSGHSEIICNACKENGKRKEYSARVSKSERRRASSFIFGGITAVIVLIIALFCDSFSSWQAGLISVGIAIALYCFVSCCILDNNFIGDMTLEIISFGFVKMPGLIFTFDVDGCLWFIGMKILLFLLGISLVLAACVLAVVLGSALSIIVYPFAIVKNVKHPERTNI